LLRCMSLHLARNGPPRMSVECLPSGVKQTPPARPRLPFLTQPVWKRFSYPN